MLSVEGVLLRVEGLGQVFSDHAHHVAGVLFLRERGAQGLGFGDWGSDISGVGVGVRIRELGCGVRLLGLGHQSRSTVHPRNGGGACSQITWSIAESLRLHFLTSETFLMVSGVHTTIVPHNPSKHKLQTPLNAQFTSVCTWEPRS